MNTLEILNALQKAEKDARRLAVDLRYPEHALEDLGADLIARQVTDAVEAMEDAVSSLENAVKRAKTLPAIP
jgi:hypothetical protein